MRRSAVTVAALGLTLACSPAPRGLQWTIDFESAALHDQTSVVEARILRGTCTGVVLYRAEVRSSARMAMNPPELPPGTYAFAATAYDATCTAIGDDCRTIDLPGPTAVANLLRAHAGTAACAAALCHTGSCEMDSGMPDAGHPDAAGDADRLVDVGPIDVGTIDVGMNDAATCATRETSCTNTRDDDCDGRTDCADPDCASDAGCARCVGVTCASCQACNPATGACGMAAEGDACPSGRCAAGACCTGCVLAGACQVGTAANACGQGGLACATCGECTGCSVTGACFAAGDGSVCAGGAGHCAGGSCCRGCRDSGGACNAGGSPSACGSSGSACSVCSECQSCSGAGCVNAADGTMCSVGRCLSGTCCNGCFIVGTCQPGNTVAACGPVGGSCVACGECQTCNSTGVCSAGPDGASCMGGAGSCQGGSCCTGCMAAGVCQPGTADGQCGYFGNACGTCPGGTCTNQVCAGIGDDCATFIDISAIGTYVFPIDTCALADNFTWPSCFGGAPAPPAGTRDAVFRGVNPGTYQFHVAPGITVGSLDDIALCAAFGGQCADGGWSVAGGTGNPFYFFGVELSSGVCRRITVTIDHPF